MIKTH